MAVYWMQHVLQQGNLAWGPNPCCCNRSWNNSCTWTYAVQPLEFIVHCWLISG